MSARNAVKAKPVKRAAVQKRATKQMAVTKDEAAERTPELPAVKEPPLRPAQCRAHMRRRLANEFRDIVNGFVQSAKSGSCQHIKLATELLESSKRKTSQTDGGRRTLNRLIRQMEQMDDK